MYVSEVRQYQYIDGFEPVVISSRQVGLKNWQLKSKVTGLSMMLRASKLRAVEEKKLRKQMEIKTEMTMGRTAGDSCTNQPGKIG